MRATTASKKKNPAQVIALATERKVDDTIVDIKRLQNVANDIALARMDKEKISEGINHAPGPIPRLKKAKYNANAKIAIPDELELPKKLIDNIRSAAVIPQIETNKIGRRPLRSNSFPPIIIKISLTMASPIKMYAVVGSRESKPAVSRIFSK
mmetsp:Transcript_12447/g.19177  ORF Transcript_12447/g.19177 Transcript_12447/m.19177 type:complete len:153 (+) Transcript_12447:332-790(+)